MVLAAGCRGILGIEDPIIQDAAPDGPPIDPRCPAPPTGCTAFACGGILACYYHCGSDLKQAWTNASSYCTAKGLGCLAPIKTPLEAACLGSRATSDPLWLNYAQQTAAAEPAAGWDWGCSTVTSFTNWALTEPNNLFGDEDCGAIKDTSGRVFDEKCITQYRFACVKPP